MCRLGVVVVALVAACGESTHVSTSSVPPSGNGADGGAVPRPPDAGTIGVDGGAVDAGAAGGGGNADAGSSAVDGGGSSGDDGGVPGCTLAGPTKLASAHVVPKILVDGDYAYYLDVASAFAGFYRVRKQGGTPTLLQTVMPLSNDGVEWDFAIGETALYLIYTTISSTGFDRNAVIVIDKSSGAKRSVKVTSYGCTLPAFTRVTAAGGTAWLVQHNSVPLGSACTQAQFDTIEMLPAGATKTLAIKTVAPDTTAILADATHLFWSGAQGTFRALHDGSSVEPLAPVAAGQLVTDGQTLFAAVGSSVDAITAPQQLATIYDGASSRFPRPIAPLAVDDSRVWVATPSAVVAIGKDGAAPRTIVPAGSSAVAVDADQVFYGGVMTACK